MAHALFAQDHQISCLPDFAIAPAIWDMCCFCPKDDYQCIILLVVSVISSNFKMFLTNIDVWKRKKTRAPCQYTEQERQLLEPFREIYRSESNRDVRKHIWRSKILTAMFNHWTDNARIQISEEEFHRRVAVSFAAAHVMMIILTYQVLAKWVANNWRPYSTEKAAKGIMRTTYIDVLWRERKDDVMNELKRMLGVTDFDKGDQRVFMQRTAAAKRVYEQMNEQEKQEINKLVELYKEEGNDAQTRLQ